MSRPYGVPEREVARALLVDPDDRLLLICYEASRDVDPARPGRRDFWYTPGGGREAGETLAQTCLRELAEETGMTGLRAGPPIARREALQTLFRRHRFVRETYFLVRAPHSELDISRLQETEGDPVLDVRWWSLEELRASDAFFEPPEIIDLFEDVLAKRRGGTAAIPFGAILQIYNF